VKKIHNWFHNHRGEADESENDRSQKNKRFWKLRTVTEHMEKKSVDARARALSGATGGDAKYLGQYPKALSQIIGELSKEKRDEYEALADKWNTEGASESAQRK
jgi:hypothetical protein